jgi:uncharacterized SAM-binding protein YcdF (DUF218 family)
MMPHGQHKGSALFRSAASALRLLLAAYGLFMLIIFCSPLADYTVRPLGVTEDLRPAPAIVVLTAYVSEDGVLNESAMRRIHTASRLYRDGLAPLVIISGGDPTRPSTRQPADFMAQFAGELGIPSTAILLEKASENTHASAINVSALCRQRRIERVLLVTNAVHMRRAVSAFRAQHLSVSPAPADPWALHWETPGIRLRKFWGALHEYGGLLYYWWRGWI